MKRAVRIVCVADTHGRNTGFEVPRGDILIHAGDYLADEGGHRSMGFFARWLASQPHRYKILIGGNHDGYAERHPQMIQALLPKVIYLENDGVTLFGLRFWGSPMQASYGRWAYYAGTEAMMQGCFAQAPAGLDVLITHRPPLGTLDQIAGEPEHLGCPYVAALAARVRPRVHLFGHVHTAHGRIEHDGTQFVNASVVDESRVPMYPAAVIDLTIPA